MMDALVINTKTLPNAQGEVPMSSSLVCSGLMQTAGVFFSLEYNVSCGIYRSHLRVKTLDWPAGVSGQNCDHGLGK